MIAERASKKRPHALRPAAQHYGDTLMSSESHAQHANPLDKKARLSRVFPIGKTSKLASAPSSTLHVV